MATVLVSVAATALWLNPSVPEPRRCGHASTALNQQIWSFGGLNEDRVALNTFWVLNGQSGWHAAALTISSSVPLC